MNRWENMLLKNDKNEILAGVIKNGKDFSVIAYRSKSYIRFDNFKTIDEARNFAERAER